MAMFGYTAYLQLLPQALIMISIYV